MPDGSWSIRFQPGHTSTTSTKTPHPRTKSRSPAWCQDLHLSPAFRIPAGLRAAKPPVLGSHCVVLVDALLDFGDGLAGVEPFGADLGAVHDGVAAVQLVGVIQLGHALLREIVPAIYQPPVLPVVELSMVKP